MKPPALKTSFFHVSIILVLGIVLHISPTLAYDQPVKEKEFLSSSDVVICELEDTTISKLDLEKNKLPSFVSRMERENRKELKQSRLTLANRPFMVLLGDRPEREFFLYDIENKYAPYWWGSWSLYSYHKIDDKFYEFILIEDGEKIAVRQYKGEMGTIKVGKGSRELEKVEFNGSVHQAGNVSAPIGTIKEHWPESVGEYQVPVGDYTANIMHVTFDNLDICISNNYHTNAQGQSGGDKKIVYGMMVRENKPYVFDFSNKPMVVFDQPPTSKTTFSRGEEIKFAAVLIDPKLDIMIRGLDDTSVKVDRELKDPNGKVIQTIKVSKSLDPNVVITRDDGEIIAEGVMPFG
jgi:hypothetical protein